MTHPDFPEVAETGVTLCENARLKAETISINEQDGASR